jgi:endonuclease/exonuclease/phosphatase (EEP) superfamily protein YafD
VLASGGTSATIKHMGERLRQHRTQLCLVMGTVALGGAAYAAHEVYEAWPRYGEVTAVVGTHPTSLPLEQASIITANARNELPEKNDDLREEIELENPSILAIQETNAKAAKALAAEYPKWSVVYGQADAKRPNGGIGNLIMSKTPLRNGRAYKIDEPGLVEDRIVTAATTDIVIEGRREEIQVLSYHISRHNGYRQEEFGKLLRIVEAAAGNADSTIACGDANTTPWEIQNRFGMFRFEAKTPSFVTYIGKSGEGTSIVDSCAYYTKGRIGFKKAIMAKKFRTDHRPVRYLLEKMSTADEMTVR